ISGKPVKSVDDAKACAKYFLERGIPRVIITLGVNGALLAGEGTMELIPACKVETKDTSGAGDAFIGSFATFLGEGLAEREAISQACLYASLSTMTVGTQKSFMTRAAFEAERKTRR
ncbi:MAG: PfkB family carbohydrate kinase, partial [Vicinamibacterales bacterium]